MSASSREALEAMKNVSELLNTGLTSEQLVTCVKLIEEGINPEVLANIVIQLRTATEESGVESVSQ